VIEEIKQIILMLYMLKMFNTLRCLPHYEALVIKAFFRVVLSSAKSRKYCQSRIMCGSYGKTSHMADIGHFQK